MPKVSGLLTTAGLKTKTGEVESKIPDVSGLVKKTDNNAKLSDTEGKYLTTCDCNKFVSKRINRKL